MFARIMAALNPPQIARLNTAVEEFESANTIDELWQSINLGNRERARLLADGIDSMNALCEEYKNNIEGFEIYLNNLNKTFSNSSVNAQRVRYPPIMVNKLLGILHYFVTCFYHLWQIPRISAITGNRVYQLSDIYKSRKEELADDNKEDKGEITMPNYKGHSTWRELKEKLLLKLSLTTGRTGITLDYVVDETPRQHTRTNSPRGMEEWIDNSDQDILKRRAIHFGPIFKEDNSKVWAMLKITLMNTPGYNMIAPFEANKDGQKAYLALKTFNEGEDFIARSIEEGFNKLHNKFYRGESCRFSFERFVAIHMEAHKLLHDAGYNNGFGLDETTKCTLLKNGIKDSGLDTALSLARSNVTIQNNFQNFVAFLSAEVHHKNLRKQQLGSKKEKNVSKVAQKGKAKKALGPVLSKVVEGKKIEGRMYSRDEYIKLSDAQKKAVIELKRERYNRAKKPHGSKAEDKTINAINILTDDMSNIGDAIIAGVLRDVNEVSETPTDNDTIQTQISKKSAIAGSVGEYLAQKKKKNTKDE